MIGRYVILAAILAWSTVPCASGQSPAHYVSLSGAHVPPFDSWATAATNIQAAVDAAEMGDTVLVTNGVYDSGGMAGYPSTSLLTTRVVIAKAITVRSVNGPDATAIVGAGPIGDAAVRCAYLANGASLAGFTLTNGHTMENGRYAEERTGGGLYCDGSSVISNCIFARNRAYWAAGGTLGGSHFNCRFIDNSAAFGGGAFVATLDHCMLTGNGHSEGAGAWSCTAYNCLFSGNTGYEGGGAGISFLRNCTVAGNSAHHGGGIYDCTTLNCIIYSNSAPDGPNYKYDSSYPNPGQMEYTCTTPGDPFHDGNISDAPLFVNAAAGDYRLQPGSPCINAGTNQDWMAGATDLDGNPRIRGGRVDMGAYERALSLMPDEWLTQHGLELDGSEDHGDRDTDGMDNWQEWRCGTDPTNGGSRLTCVASNGLVTPAGIVVRWQSVTGKTYRLERSTNLVTQPPFGPVASSIMGQAESTAHTDTTAVGQGPYLYRVGVE